MNEASVYIVERNAWSIVGHCDVHFRLTYEREFIPVQNLWRDFLVHCEEIGSVLPTANQFSTGKIAEAQGPDAFFDGAILSGQLASASYCSLAYSALASFSIGMSRDVVRSVLHYGNRPCAFGVR